MSRLRGKNGAAEVARSSMTALTARPSLQFWWTWRCGLLKIVETTEGLLYQQQDYEAFAQDADVD